MSFYESIKATLRGALGPERRDLFRRNRRRATEVLRIAEQETISAVAATAQLLPLHVVSRLKNELHPTGTLDYERARILMGVASPMEYYRLGSCAKEPETIQWLESNVRPGDVFYDVGANVGAYSLVADAIAGCKATIIAVEPSFATFAQLNHNVFLNQASERITPLCVALSSAMGTASFHYSDLSSGSAFHSLTTTTGDGASLRVLTVTMDDLVERFSLPAPNLLKVDVDGAEIAAMRGADGVLARSTLRSILIELDQSLAETADLVRQLEQFGFVESSRHRRHDSPYHNHIFVRSSS